MALSELTSNLSWYGANAGFRAQQSVEQTRFNYDPGDLTLAVAPRGFDNAGFQSNAFMPKVSGNAFNIFDYGTATRRSQLGTGTKFPIGPKGETHEFDIKRTGFHDSNRYETVFNSKSNSGLASTYTLASPIDDMYNKFKVRDEAYDPFGYAKPPFVLRGIQRDDSSKPQRWGLGDTTAGMIASLLDIPRGGPLVMGDRIISDTERLGKLMIRPQGLAFIAKQQLLHLMSPNTEGVTGYPNLNYATNQKLSNPANTLASALGSPLGVRFKKYGLLPVDDEISKYGDIHRLRNTLSTSALPVNVTQNRLVLMLGDRDIGILPTWLTLDSVAGPNSVGGIGATIFRKRSEYDTQKIGTVLQRSLDDAKGRTFLTQYISTIPYVSNTDTTVDTRKFNLFASTIDPTAKDSLRIRISSTQFTAIPQREVQQAASNQKREQGDIVDITAYKTLAYGKIKSLAKERTHSNTITKIIDPTMDGAEYQAKDTPIAKKLLTYTTTQISGQKDTTRITETNKNYITLKIGDVSLYAYLSSLNFSNQFSTNELKGAMEAYPEKTYSSHERGIGLGFMIAAKSPTELESNWKKIKRLQRLSAPVYTNNVIFPTRTSLTVGSIVRSMPVFMDSISFDIDNESPWEITPNYQYPYYITVDCEFSIIPSSATSLPVIG